MKSKIVLTIVMGLAACSVTGGAQKERVRIRDDLMAAVKQALPCVQRLAATPKYAVLRERISVDTATPPTDAQLADTETPTLEMLQLGMEWYSDNQACSRGFIEGLARIDPDLGVATTGWLIETADIYQDALTNRPTYGHINERIKHLKEREQSDIRQWGANLNARLKRQQEREEAQAQENSRRFKAAIGAVSEFAANALIAAVQVLATRQAALDQVQRQYVLVVPAYQPVQITRTTCSYVAASFTCTQVSF